MLPPASCRIERVNTPLFCAVLVQLFTQSIFAIVDEQTFGQFLATGSTSDLLRVKRLHFLELSIPLSRNGSIFD
jgi:hypothetical protein